MSEAADRGRVGTRPGVSASYYYPPWQSACKHNAYSVKLVFKNDYYYGVSSPNNRMYEHLQNERKQINLSTLVIARPNLNEVW